MANRYWGYLNSTWNNVNTAPWSDVPVGGGVGTQAGFAITLSKGTTANMAVGHKVYKWTGPALFTQSSTITGIINSTQFNITIPASITTPFTITTGNMGSSISYPTSSDNVFIQLPPTDFAGVTITIPTATTVACADFTFTPSAGATSVATQGTGSIAIAGTTLGSSILQIYGNVVIGTPTFYATYTLSGSFLYVQLKGTTKTFTKYGVSAMRYLYVLGSYTQATDITTLAIFLYCDSGSWTTNNFVCNVEYLYRSSTGTGAFSWYCGTTVVGVTSTTADNVLSLSTGATFDFFTTGGYFHINGAGTTSRTQSGGASAQSANPPNVKITSGASTLQSISGFYGNLDLTTCSCTWAVSSFVQVQSFQASSLAAQNNLTVYATKGGGTLNFVSSRTQSFLISHSTAFSGALIGTTTMGTASNPGTSISTVTIVSGRLSIPAGYGAFYSQYWAFTGTLARGIDIGAGATLNMLTNASGTLSCANASNFSATGDFTFYFTSVNSHTMGWASDGTTGPTCNSVTSYPSFVLSANSSTGTVITNQSAFNSINLNGLTSSSTAVVRNLWIRNIVGSTATTPFFNSTTFYFWGTGNFDRGVNTVARLQFESSTAANMPKGTTTMVTSYLNTVDQLIVKDQNINWNNTNYTNNNAGSAPNIGGTSFTNVGTFTVPQINAQRAGTVTLNDGTYTCTGISVLEGSYGVTTLVITGGTYSNLTGLNVGAGGTLTFGANFTKTTCSTTVTNNTSFSTPPVVNLGGYTVSLLNVTFNSSAAAYSQSLNGTGTLQVNGTFTGDTRTTGNGTAIISMVSASAKTFAGGGGSYGTLNQGGAGVLTVTGSSTFADMTATSYPSTIKFTSGTTQTVSAFNVNGIAGNLVTINSTTPTSQATLSKSSGTVTANYLSLQDSNATGGAVWNAPRSTFVSNVTGWLAGYIKSRFLTFFG